MFSAEHVCRKIANELRPIVTFTQLTSSLRSTVLNVVFECGTWEGCDVRSSMRTSFPLLSHRLLHFVHGRHRLLDHPILRRALTPRQLSVACTLLVPANIRATTRRYRKAHRTQFTLRHATVRQLCYPNASNPRLHFLFGAIFFQRGLRHLISREYGKQRAHPKNAGDYPMRIHHPWHVTVVS